MLLPLGQEKQWLANSDLSLPWGSWRYQLPTQERPLSSCPWIQKRHPSLALYSHQKQVTGSLPNKGSKYGHPAVRIRESLKWSTSRVTVIAKLHLKWGNAGWTGEGRGSETRQLPNPQVSLSRKAGFPGGLSEAVATGHWLP